jgi:hypothetical protein
MDRHLPRLLLTLGALLPAAAAHAGDPAASLDGWPAWVHEAMAAEAKRLKFKRVETPDDSVRTRLPGKTEAPQPLDDGWYFISDIKAESPLECYLFTSSRDLATLTDVITEANIEAVAGSHDNVGNRRIFHTEAGEVAGLPYLALEWIYTVEQNGQTMVGFTKVRAATKGERAFVCNHNYLGYRETFARAFDGFVTSTEVGDGTPPPFYEEIATLDMNGPGAGVTYASYTSDDDGDIRLYTAEAAIIPVDPTTITTSDSYTVTFASPDGELINAHEIGVENGEITSNMTLQRNDAGTWISAGTLQGKDLEFEIDGALQPASEWRQMAIARNLFAGDETSASLLVWTPSIDPTRFLDAGMTRDDAEVQRQAILTLGPISYTGRFDTSGNLENADMAIGPMTLRIERIWSQGSLRE